MRSRLFAVATAAVVAALAGVAPAAADDPIPLGGPVRQTCCGFLRVPPPVAPGGPETPAVGAVR